MASEPGEGSTFWFTLRLDPALGPASPPRTDARLVGVRVLAVDDNATNREVLRAQLAAAGMRCDVAASGPEALGLLAAAADGGDPYALAILDQNMPEMDGRELARRIKADAAIASTRLLMLGSMGRPLDPREHRASGIVAWATKPIWRVQLLRALGAALEGPESRAAPPLAASGAAPTKPGRLLLVEDTPINAEVVVEIVRSAGYAIDVAVDGFQAVDAARRAPYDLILMDCQLPGIDGYEATRRIRGLEASGQLGRRGPTAIVALTASATREDLERARLAGMDGHIAKPVDARRLLAIVAAHAGETPEAVVDAPPGRLGDTKAVDLDRSLQRLQGNRGLLDRMVEELLASAREARGSLRADLGRREAEPYVFAVHRLRGQALGLDAAQLAAALGVLESTVAREDWAASEAMMPAVEAALDAVVGALARR